MRFSHSPVLLMRLTDACGGPLLLVGNGRAHYVLALVVSWLTFACSIALLGRDVGPRVILMRWELRSPPYGITNIA